VTETLSTKEAVRRLLVEMAGSSAVINRPDMRLLSRTVAQRLGRPVSDHDVSKVLWGLQKEGRIKLAYTHRTGASRTGTIVRIEVLR
jgi:hypothetical protein